jgi:hypothetical protein
VGPGARSIMLMLVPRRMWSRNCRSTICGSRSSDSGGSSETQQRRESQQEQQQQQQIAARQ